MPIADSHVSVLASAICHPGTFPIAALSGIVMTAVSGKTLMNWDNRWEGFSNTAPANQ